MLNVQLALGCLRRSVIVLVLLSTLGCSVLEKTALRAAQGVSGTDKGMHVDAGVQLGQNNTKSTDRRLLHFDIDNQSAHTADSMYVVHQDSAWSIWLAFGIGLMIVPFIKRPGALWRGLVRGNVGG